MPLLEERLGCIVRSDYGLTGDLARLGGEVDMNFTLTGPDGRFFVKFVASEAMAAARLQVDIIRQLNAIGAGLPVPHLRWTRDGRPHASLDGRVVWITDFREGTPCHPNESSAELRMAAGASLADLDLALARVTVDEPPRTAWDLQRCAELVESASRAPVVDGALLCDELTVFQEVTLTALAARPQQLIHNDLNRDNLLVRGDRPTTILDFGDVVIGSRLQELGTALAYLTDDRDEQACLESMRDLVVGYHGAWAMSDEDIVCLPAVARARCAFALLLSRLNASRAPSGQRGYLLRNEVLTDRRRELFGRLDSQVLGQRLLDMIDGFTPARQ